MTAFDRAYRWLLTRAPASFRRRYGDEMRALAAARVRDCRGLARPRRALQELTDVLFTVWLERRRAGGGTSAATTAFGADVRTACMSLRRTPAATVAIAATLTLGLGAGALGFSLLSTVLLRPLPFGQPDQLVLLWGFAARLQAGFPEMPLHGVRFVQLRQSTTSFATLEGFKADVFNLDAPDIVSERINGLVTTASLFDTLRVHAAAGRFFAPGEDAPAAPCAVVIGYGLWQRHFGGLPGVVSRTVRLNDRLCTIVGVAPRGFDFPRGGEMPPSFEYPNHTELWMAAPPPSNGPSDLTVLARLRDGVSRASAQAELDAQARQRDDQIRGSRGWNDIRVVPLTQQIVPPRIALTVSALFAAVAILLLVAAANAAQLLVVRGLGRRRDLAIRAAFGASPRRLVRVAAIEALTLTLVAAGAGIALAAAGVRAVRLLGPDRFPRLAETVLDGRAVGFVVAASALVTLVTALGPVVLTRRASLETVLRGRTRGSSDHLLWWRTGLVAMQMTLAVLLITVSGLLVRGFVARLAVDPGFLADHALTFEVTLPATRYPEVLRGPVPADRPRTVAAIDSLLTHLRALPGAASVAMGKPLPMSGAQEASVFAAEGWPVPRSAAEVPVAEYIVISDDFFRTIGTSITAGREFTHADQAHSEPVTVISETMARQLWPSSSAVGRHVKLGGTPTSPAPWLTVVGVAKDMKRYGLDDTPGPTMYVHYTQGAYPSLATVPFVIRTTLGDPMALLAGVREAARASGLDVPVAAPETLAMLVARVSADARFAMALMVAFAAGALALTIAGLYGIVALAVSLRWQELGIRAALGAVPTELVRLVILDGLRPAIGGGLTGMACSVAAAYELRAVLFGVSPVDPVTFTLVPVALAAITALACLVPARQAAAADPRRALAE
jgi:predicted permease